MQFLTTLVISAFGITTVVAQYDSCTSSTSAPIDSSIPAQAASAWVSFFANGHQTSAASAELICSYNEGCYSYNGEAFCYDVSTSTARFADGSSGNLHTASYHVNELAKARRAVDLSSSSSSSSSKASSSTASTVSTASVKLTTTSVNSTTTSKPATSTSSSSKSSVVIVSTTSKPASSTSVTSTAKASSALANGMIHAVPEGGFLVLGAAGLVALIL